MKNGWWIPVLIVWGFLALLILTSASTKAPEEDLPILLTLSTESIATLEPHGHSEQDEVSDIGHGEVVGAPTVVTTEDMWVQGIRVQVENAPHVTLHHMNVIVTPASSEKIPSEFANGFGLSMGQDIADTHILPKPYATFIPKGTKLMMSAMLHNPLPPKGPGGEYENVSVSVTLLGLGFDEKYAKQTFPISITLVDADSRGNDSFTVPPRTEHFIRDVTSEHDRGRATYIFRTSGTIVDVGAHLHAWEGGERVDVYLNGKQIQSFVPRLAGENPWDWRTDGVSLKKRVMAGDVLTISATYSNEHDEPLVGAMGIVGLSFSPDN